MPGILSGTRPYMDVLQMSETEYAPLYPMVAGNSLERMTPEIERFTQGSELAFELWSHDLDRLEGQSDEHSHRSSVLAVGLASHMGLSEEECMHIRHGALLHEIGTLVIPDSILLKPAKISRDVCLVVRTHPTRGYALPTPIAIRSRALEIPLYHHERWDGTGYPFHLNGQEIPLSARIFAVVDAWDTLSMDAARRRGSSTQQVMSCLTALSAKHFDPAVLDAFVKLIESRGSLLQTVESTTGDRGTIGTRVKHLWTQALKRYSGPNSD